MITLHLDFETRSACNLKTRMIHNYAMDPSTDVLCVAWKVDSEATQLWYPKPIADIIGISEAETIRGLNGLLTDMARADRVMAHNAEFERLIWKHVMVRKYHALDIPLRKWYCTAAHVASYALPRSLEGAADAIGSAHRKDPAGKALITRLCSPDKNLGAFLENADDFSALGRYCMQDVETEAALVAAVPKWPDAEQEVWRLDQRINDNGLMCDVEGIGILEAMVKEAKGQLEERIAALSNGAVESSRQRDVSLEWLKANGLELPDLTKQTVIDALLRDDLTAEVRDFLTMRQSESLSSVSKLAAMRQLAGPDNRLRGMFLYHGASTGRWAAKKVQPHNFPRNCYTTTEAVDAAIAGNYDEPDAIQAASRCLRGLLVAEDGHVLMAIDFNAIESRALGWLAGEQSVLDAYKDGKDLYRINASNIFRKPYESIGDEGRERLVGKVAELALGYQGWAAAFVQMGKGYGLKMLSADEVEVCRQHWERRVEVQHPLEVKVKGPVRKLFPTLDAYVAAESDARAVAIIKPWRASRPATKALWYGLEDAAIKAVQNPGDAFGYRGVKFMLARGFLLMRLPSNRNLAYYAPELEMKTDKYGREKMTIGFMGVNPETKRWEKQFTYGGSLTENAVQAISRDLLVNAMQNLELMGHKIVMHVHDEVVVEHKAEGAEAAMPIMKKLVEATPAWAAGLPLGSKGWIARRYRK
jgi:DNA polymerase bacteriophage-type